MRLELDPKAADASAPEATDVVTARQAAIDRATSLWRDVGVGEASRDAPTATDAVTIEFVAGGPVSFGLYDGADRRIYVNRALTADESAITIAHELGHAFGLVHVPPATRASVMNAGNLTLAPNLGDRDAIDALWGACAATR